MLNVKNNAESTLAAEINDSALELTLATGEGALFPATNFHISIDDEIILCSSRTTDVCTIEREAESTTAATHASGAKVELRITAQHITDLNTATDANTDKITESTTVTSPLVKTTYDISIPAATTSVSGYLTTTDWDTFNEKASTTSPTFATSITGSYLTASEILITDGDKKIVSAPVATYPSLTELAYVKGLSSAVQTQLTGKLPLTGGTMTGDIQLGETDIKLDAVLSGDEKWSGITVVGTAGATLAVGDVCFLQTADSKWELVDGILDGTDLGFKLQLGICVLAANADAATEMLVYGKVRSAAFPAFTVGAPVYLDDTAGDLVVAQPDSANFAIRVCGYALTAEDLMFCPDNSYIVHV